MPRAISCLIMGLEVRGSVLSSGELRPPRVLWCVDSDCVFAGLGVQTQLMGFLFGFGGVKVDKKSAIRLVSVGCACGL